MDKTVVVWEPSNEGPRLWRSFDGEFAHRWTLAYLAGVCESGSYVAIPGDSRSIVVMSLERVAQEAA